AVRAVRRGELLLKAPRTPRDAVHVRSTAVVLRTVPVERPHHRHVSLGGDGLAIEVPARGIPREHLLRAALRPGARHTRQPRETGKTSASARPMHGLPFPPSGG